MNPSTLGGNHLTQEECCLTLYVCVKTDKFCSLTFHTVFSSNRSNDIFGSIDKTNCAAWYEDNNKCLLSFPVFPVFPSIPEQPGMLCPGEDSE